MDERTSLDDKIDISDIPRLELKPRKLHEASIIEFTTMSGKHFRLALCERELWGSNVQQKYLYVSDDMRTYCTLMDFHGIGVPVPFHSLRAEESKFVQWVPKAAQEKAE